MDNSIQNRVNRDMSEGVMAIRSNGEIMYINRAAEKILAVSGIREGDRCIDIFKGELLACNDGFLQCIMDAVYSKTETFRNKVAYTDSLGYKHYLRVTSSFLYDKENRINDGVVLCFSDITAEILNEKKARDSVIFYILIMSSVCLWILFYSALNWFHIELEDFLLSEIETAIAIIICACILKFTCLTVKDIGLSMKADKKHLLTDSILTAGALLLMIGYKFIAGYQPPFWRFDLLNISDVFYPLTVVLQEIMSRSITQEISSRIMSFRFGNYAAILVTALQFGVLHIHKGFPYMLGAVLLLFIFGLIYDRQKSIWGLCIIHYVLGTAFVVILGFQ